MLLRRHRFEPTNQSIYGPSEGTLGGYRAPYRNHAKSLVLPPIDISGMVSLGRIGGPWDNKFPRQGVGLTMGI